MTAARYQRDALWPMSAIAPKAHIGQRRRHVRFVPKADIPLRIDKSKKDYLWFKRALAYQPWTNPH
jgi:hypothetical protein